MLESLKAFVAERARGCCEYCLTRADHSSDPFAIEHILPRVLGGTDDLENLALSCFGCNNFKYTATEAIDPDSGEQVTLFNPRIHAWETHFKWSDNSAHIEGKTSIGRATLVRLRLNRPGLVNLRIALAAVGKHPPF